MSVMDPVDEEMDARAEFAGKLPMEEMTVGGVFDQRPGDVSERDAQHQGERRHLCSALPQEVGHRDQIEERYRPVGARQRVDDGIGKYAGRSCKVFSPRPW